MTDRKQYGSRYDVRVEMLQVWNLHIETTNEDDVREIALEHAMSTEPDTQELLGVTWQKRRRNK